MEFKIISDIENPLFNRREIEGETKAEITPSREEIRELLSKELSVSKDVIKIRTILGKFGEKLFIINANIYKSKQEKDSIELQKKKDLEAEKKQEEKPVEDVPEKPEEKPVEEVAEVPTKEVSVEKPVEEVKEEAKSEEVKTE